MSSGSTWSQAAAPPSISRRVIHATPVEELTEIPEMLGGRVKTLHPRIHAAILARRDHPDDLAALDDHGIKPIDLVCVGFYPFMQIVSRHGVTEADAVEMIDIGGPSMLRAAAKNFAHVVPVRSPKRYPGDPRGACERRGGLPRTPGGDWRPRPSRRPRRTKR